MMMATVFWTGHALTASDVRVIGLVVVAALAVALSAFADWIATRLGASRAQRRLLAGAILALCLNPALDAAVCSWCGCCDPWYWIWDCCWP